MPIIQLDERRLLTAFYKMTFIWGSNKNIPYLKYGVSDMLTLYICYFLPGRIFAWLANDDRVPT